MEFRFILVVSSLLIVTACDPGKSVSSKTQISSDSSNSSPIESSEESKLSSESISSGNSSSFSELVSSSEEKPNSSTSENSSSSSSNSTSEEDEKIITYGLYPQSLVAPSSLTVELNDKAGNLPFQYATQVVSLAWNSYKYYIKSDNSFDFMFYQDIDLDEDGVFDYRGVYFLAYRPSAIQSNVDSNNQEDNGYTARDVYWFKYEPIQWNVLEAKNGEKLVITKDVIDSQNFSIYSPGSSPVSKTDYKGETGQALPNNYKYSEIRTFLNTTFLNSAFTSNQKSKIKDTEVDNSIESTNFSSSDYLCENTVDKIFLLSSKEVLNRRSIDMGGEFIFGYKYTMTDYAVCMGLNVMPSTDENGKTCSWWTRTGSTSDIYYTLAVDSYNGLNEYATADSTSIGVRPAMVI